MRADTLGTINILVTQLGMHFVDRTRMVDRIAAGTHLSHVPHEAMLESTRADLTRYYAPEVRWLRRMLPSVNFSRWWPQYDDDSVEL